MHFSGFSAVLLAANPTAWLTPIWLIGVGCLLGLAVLAVLFGFAKLLVPKLAAVAADTLREGFVFPVLSVAGIFAGFAIVSLLLQAGGVGFLPLSDITRSLSRLPRSDSFHNEFTVLAVPKEERGAKPQEFYLDSRPEEIRSLEISSDQDLEFYLRDPGTYNPGAIAQKITLNGKEPWTWSVKPDSGSPFSGRRVTLFVLNPADQAAKLIVSGVTREEYPQVAVVLYTAAAVAGVVLFYLALRLAFPKIMAIASATSKEAVSQPLFQVVLAVGAFALVAFIFIPYNTFGEDVKMLKMGALEWIMALAILVAAWTASVSVSEEIEGRTALTVLSKPVSRIQFILGKFFGVVQAVSILYVILGTILLVTVSGKVVYDVRESVLPDALWTDCFAEMMDIVPGLVLAFFETIVMAAISVAISTRLPMLPNLLISFSIYALGNLAPLLVQAKVNDPYGIVRFVGQFFATILPVLENFNIQAAISAGLPVPISYLGWAMLYCFLYSTIAMLLALALFEDRDLA